MTAESASPGTPPLAAPARSGLAWRLVTAAIGIPILLGVIYAGGPLYVAIVAVALAAGAFEFARAMKVDDSRLVAVLVVAAAASAVAAIDGSTAVLSVLVVATAASFLALLSRGEPPASLTPWAISLAGILYVGLLGQFFVALRWLEDGREWVYLAAFTTFATDTGAYAIGRLLGRHKLAPRLSPNKTVEGGAGGLVAGALAAVALDRALGLEQPMAAMLALGAGAAVVGQVGDLSESLIKRVAGVKDMGNILPGHGGILDRLDSLLFVVPLVYLAARALA